jgi:hypothetical protein
MTQLRVTLIALVWCTAPSASAKELWERPWIEVHCPHFVIVSALPEKLSVDLARDLEHFRAAVVIMTHIEPFDESIPTKVYVLPQPVEKLGFKGDVAGYFVPEMRANYAAVTPRPGTALDDVLKHEYVLFPVHNRDANIYPTWLDEGFAELFSTLAASGNVIEYGEPTPARVSWLAYRPWLPFEQVLDTRDVTTFGDTNIQMFYAQSWLLVHYLMNGSPDRKFSNDAMAFLRLVETGVTAPNAFEQAFGLPVSKLHAALLAYIGGGQSPAPASRRIGRRNFGSCAQRFGKRCRKCRLKLSR